MICVKNKKQRAKTNTVNLKFIRLVIWLPLLDYMVGAHRGAHFILCYTNVLELVVGMM